MPIPDRKACLAWLRLRWPAVLYGVLVGVIFWQAAVLRLHIPQTPLIDPDSWGYLNPGFAKLTGGYFEHTFGRNFVYPGFVFMVLCVCGDYEALGVAQHCLGLLTGVFVLLAWNVLGTCLQVSPRVRTAVRFGGLLLVAAYLYHRTTIILEHTIRPEAVFPFFLGLSFLLNLLALRALLTREGEPARYTAWCLAANLVVTYVGWSLKPSMGLGTVAANLPLLFWLWRGKEAARRKAAIIGAGVAVIVVGLWWPEKVLASRDKFTQIFLPTMLFTIHADMIHEQIVEDLARHDTAPYPPEWLATFNRTLEQSLTEAQTTDLGGWRSLGFNADHLIYRRSVFDPFFPRGDEAAEAAFCMHYYKRAWLHRPGEMAAKICRQLGLVYRFRFLRLRDRRAWLVDGYTGQVQRPMSFDYRNSLKDATSPALHPRLIQSRYGNAYVRRLEKLSHTKALFWQALSVGVANRLLDVLNLPLLIIGGIGGFLLLRRDPRANAALLACVALCAGVNFAMFLTIAVAHSLQFERYVENQRLLTVLTEFAALLLPLQYLAGGSPLAPAAPRVAAEAVPS